MISNFFETIKSFLTKPFTISCYLSNQLNCVNRVKVLFALVRCGSRSKFLT